MTTSLTSLVAPAATVALSELEARAALLTRRDRKYLVPWADAERFLRQIAPAAAVLEIDGSVAFRYRSVYFDTPGRDSFLDAAYRRPRRFKVRTRSYLDSGGCQLEIKTRDRRGQTVKARQPHLIAHARVLDDADRAFVAGSPLIGPAAASLQPALTTSYTRSTLLLADGARVTIDVDLRAESPDGRVAGMPGTVVIETKTEGRPSMADRVLWVLGQRPVRISKFGTSLSVLYPELPSNKWTQALRRPWSEETAGRSSPVSLSVAD